MALKAPGLAAASSNYLGTELLRDAYIPDSYLTIDRWASEGDFRAFRRTTTPNMKPSTAPATPSPTAKPASALTPSERSGC